LVDQLLSIALRTARGACRPRYEDREIGGGLRYRRDLDRCSIAGGDGLTFTVVIERDPAHRTTGGLPNQQPRPARQSRPGMFYAS